MKTKKVLILYSILHMPFVMANEISNQSSILSFAEMDQVTAGAVNASVVAGGIATSNYLAFTRTDVIAITQANGNPDMPVVNAAAGGQVQAVAVGPGSTTSTMVHPTTNIVGPTVYTHQQTAYMAGPLGQINASGVVSIVSPTMNPF